MDKRHFTVVEKNGKEHGLYVSSTPSSAAKKVVSKLCSSNKSKKVEFYLRGLSPGVPVRQALVVTSKTSALSS